MSKIITVFGATGNQGGSVIKAILANATLSKEYKIRAVTRDPSKPSAQALVKKGAEAVSANLDSKESVLKILKGSDSVFLVTNYWETGDANVELAQGKNVTDAAKEAGVKQIIFSSLINVTEATNGKLKHVRHFDSKAEIEQYIRDTGITCTFIQAGYFMSNLTQMMQKGEDGSYSLAWPVTKQAKFPLLDIPEDYGKFIVPALLDPSKWNGKVLRAASDYYTVDRIVSEFEDVTGKKVNYHQVSNEQYKGFLPESMAEEMLENHLLIESPGYYNGASLQESHDSVGEKLVMWKEYVAKTFK